MQQVNIPPEPQQDDPQHIQNMINKVDGNPTDQSAEPPLLAGKYKTVDDLRKGINELLQRQDDKALEALYKQLESGLGKPRQDAPPAPPNPTPDTQALDQQAQQQAQQQDQQQLNQAEDLITKAGLDLAEFEQEFAAQGDLSEESYQKLEKAGFPRNLVATYIEGLKAIANQARQAVFEVVGGEQNYMAMLEWARVNLSEGEKRWFNNALDGDLEGAKMAVSALYARYTSATGQPPKTLIQGNVPATAGDVYESRAQLIADINNPLYERDPAFRRKVEEKLARSNLF